MAGELKGRTVSGWAVGNLIDYGRSALVLDAAKGTESCVLKVFDPEIVERYGEAVQRERIERERALIGQQHANLVPILGAGEEGGLFYVAMEKVAGRPLSKCLSEVPRNRVCNNLMRVVSSWQVF